MDGIQPKSTNVLTDIRIQVLDEKKNHEYRRCKTIGLEHINK
jgi:hypothetical protein